MSFEIKTLYFDDVTSLTHAWQVHTVGKKASWFGAYANVYDLGDQVMKLSGGDDLGYLSYLETMHTLKVNNKHLPVIHDVIYYRLTDEARKGYCMFQHQEKIVTYMEKLAQPPKHVRKTYSARGDLLHCIWPPIHRWTSRLTEYLYAPVHYCSELSLEHQELIVLLKIADEHYASKYPKDYGRFDLHNGNALMRGKTLVVTDPLA